MEKGKQNQSVAAFISRYWVRLLLALLAIYLFMQKDFSFQVNMRSPLQQEEELEFIPSAKLKKEKMTEDLSGEAVTASNSPKRDLFEMPSLFGSKSRKSTVQQQLQQISDEEKIAYLRRFARVAIAERQKFGIPSSIILSSSLLHSLAGERDMALSSNNHFGLRCTKDWAGTSANYQGQCYRVYENAWSSFRDHSIYLSNDVFSSLKEHDETDYQAWARDLEELRYSDEPNLGDRLIELIEYFRLYELDTK